MPGYRENRLPETNEMIYGVGTDIVDVKRVRQSLEKWGIRWAKKIFTDAEISKCESSPDPAGSYAARFAAKEAFFKAGRFSGSFFPREIETVTLHDSTPSIVASGRYSAGTGPEKKLHLSLSHERDMAVAIIIIEEFKTPF